MIDTCLKNNHMKDSQQAHQSQHRLTCTVCSTHSHPQLVRPSARKVVLYNHIPCRTTFHCSILILADIPIARISTRARIINEVVRATYNHKFFVRVKLSHELAHDWAQQQKARRQSEPLRASFQIAVEHRDELYNGHRT